MPCFVFGDVEPTEEMLQGEETALANDRERYLDCMNNLLLKNRETEQQKRDGVILYWQVYRFIVDPRPEETPPPPKRQRKGYVEPEILELFPTDKPDYSKTTAVYPNRKKDKARVELLRGLSEKGDSTTRLFTPLGTLFSTGYNRVVYGDHGPYIEFSPEHIQCELRKKYDKPTQPQWYYVWLEPTDGSGVKVYDQKRDVKHLKNPPAGGFHGNREEGYADYLPGMIYVSPFDLEKDVS